mgnify:CR=1 FL=1
MLAPSPPPEFAIEARGLDKTYRAQGKGQAVHALKGVDLVIPRGSFFGLLGPNGAGKSTFINILGGLVVKSGGTAAIWGHDIDADPIIDRGRVYALGQGGRMAAYELVTGQRIWELNLAGISTPAVAGDWIFTLTDDGKLLAIARATGKVRWMTQLARYENPKKKKNPIFWSGPVLAGDRLWFSNSKGQVYSASVADGTPVPFAELKESVTLAPVVAGGTLYILDDSGRITAFR